MLRPDIDAGPLVRERLSALPVAATLGVGGLPHRNPRRAAEFALDGFDIPTISALPKRSPAELPLAQGLAGVTGVTVVGGDVTVDLRRLDPLAHVITDLAGDSFVGMRTFLEVAAERRMAGPVAWHFIGPISVGVTLVNAGVPAPLAFEIARQTVRQHLIALSTAISDALPESPQLVMLKEPFAEAIMRRGFAVTPDHCVDVLSSAMAAVESVATVGVHCCKHVDASLLLEAGPHVLSLRVSEATRDVVGYVDRFLAGGGRIAWGAVATGGPVGVTANRSGHQLANLWTDLTRNGCDPQRLRQQSLLTPECGLSGFGVEVAERLCHSLRDIGRAARSDSTTARLLLDS